jgi:preprotein translocase subunit SecF
MSVFGRLYRGETTIDFVGRRKWGFGFSGLLVLVSLFSLGFRGLNLGIDFEGGVSWELSTETVQIGDVEEILAANGIEATTAKIQELSGSDGRRLRVQTADQAEEVRLAVKQQLAERAEVETQEVSEARVSSSWGSSLTNKAIRALLVFFVLVSLFIAWRFEWKMAVAAFAAMVHDVVISVGVYSVFGFLVTPATVVAFLTILGYSLYDTIVVFDRVHDNAIRLGSSRVSYGDVVNVSMNQVLMRSLNTTISSLLPVISLLVVGSWLLGAVTLREFAIALLVGLFLGAYSSIFIAAPLLAAYKSREPRYAATKNVLHLGDEMQRLMGSGREETKRIVAEPVDGLARVTSALTHPPRPRKNKRR